MITTHRANTLGLSAALEGMSANVGVDDSLVEVLSSALIVINNLNLGESHLFVRATINLLLLSGERVQAQIDMNQTESGDNGLVAGVGWLVLGGQPDLLEVGIRVQVQTTFQL